MPLLTTKLYIPPIRSELVPRPRLVALLDAGIHRKLSLISAPAGFGKTTLVNAWLRGTNRTLTWFSLDEGDNDLVRFLNYLVAAFRQIDDEIGQTAQRFLETPQLPQVERLLTELINDVMNRTIPFVLVLDDYHVITDHGIHKVVNFLLECQPPHMHLVIISRHDPLLQLSRLRGRGQITEIRQSELRFDVEEASAFLNQAMGLNLSAPEVAALEKKTEGWIAGLQMFAVALQSRIAEKGTDVVPRFIDNFTGRHHFILDYLTDEVLTRQSETVRMFLLRTSILERMCGSLCDALVDQPIIDESAFTSSQEILDALQRMNLFVVPLDDEGKWYRFHRLFAELLRVRLQETAADSINELYVKAVAWHEQNTLLAEAVHYALAIPDFDLAAGVIERAIPRVGSWSSVNVALFQEWLKVLPSEVIRSRPRLWLFASRVFYVIGQRENTERILQDLEASLNENSSRQDADEILGSVMADRASYAAVRGDVQQAITFAHRAQTNLSENAMMRMRVSVILGLAHFRAGNVLEAGGELSQAIAIAGAENLGFVAAPILCNLAEVQFIQGQLHQAYQTSQKAMQIAIVDGTPTSMAGFPGLEMGKILYEQNDLQMAEKHVVESLDLLGRSGTTDSFGIGHALLARVRQALGDDEGALMAIRRANQIAREFDIARVSILIRAYQARIWLAQAKLDLAARWAREYQRLGETEYLREFEDLTLVRVLLAQDKLSGALALLDALLPPAETAGRMGTMIEISVLRALALQGLADVDKAQEALAWAIQLAEPEGYVRLFLDEGESMLGLLRKAANLGTTSNYASKLIGCSNRNKKDRVVVDMSALIEPLSGREIEVLDLLADGLTNPEIAKELFISLPTVKSHTRNIYGKLGVHKRREAVAQARKLGILPS